jgi:hypothetical protein
MSTFYLLPPRPLLGERFAGFLQTLFPGLDWDCAMRINLADALGEAAASHPDVFVIYREDLPEGETPSHALVEGYGAEAGDEVIEIRAGISAGEMTARRWKVA